MSGWGTAQTAHPELNRESPVPLYAQLDDILRSRIRGGEWPEGMMLPSENALAKDLGISRMTARGVLKGLADDGLVTRIPGKGTFVAASKIETPVPAFRGVRAQLEQQGIATTTQVVQLEQITPTASIRNHLSLSVNEPVILVERLRSVDGNPISIHRSWIPAALAPTLTGADVVGEQLCHILADHYELFPRRITQTLESTSATRAEAKLLGLGTGSPLLLLQETTFDETDRPFEFSRIAFCGDRIRLSFEFTSQDLVEQS